MAQPSAADPHAAPALAGPFTLRELVVMAGGVLMLVGSVIPFEVGAGSYANVWNFQTTAFNQIITLVLPILLAGAFAWRRLNGRHHLAVGTLTLDQLASVIAVLTVIYFFISAVMSMNAAFLLGLIGALAMLAGSTLARYVPGFAQDFEPDQAPLLTRDIRPSAPAAPRAKDAPPASATSSGKAPGDSTAPGAASPGSSGATAMPRPTATAGAPAVPHASSTSTTADAPAASRSSTSTTARSGPAKDGGGQERTPDAGTGPGVEVDAADASGNGASTTAVPTITATEGTTTDAARGGADTQGSAMAQDTANPQTAHGHDVSGASGASSDVQDSDTGTSGSIGAGDDLRTHVHPVQDGRDVAGSASEAQGGHDVAGSATEASGEAIEEEGPASFTASRAGENENASRAFWFAVPQSRAVVDETTGFHAFTLEPGAWILALEDRGEEFVVQDTDGRIGVLRDLRNVERA